MTAAEICRITLTRALGLLLTLFACTMIWGMVYFICQNWRWFLPAWLGFCGLVVWVLWMTRDSAERIP